MFVPRKSILMLDYSYLHVAVAMMSLISLAKEYSEHHTYELSGKKGIPPCNYVSSGFLYYVAIVFLRLPTLLLLLLLFKYVVRTKYISCSIHPIILIDITIEMISILDFILFQVLVVSLSGNVNCLEWCIGISHSSSFLQQDCLDELHLHYCPHLLYIQI